MQSTHSIAAVQGLTCNAWTYAYKAAAPLTTGTPTPTPMYTPSISSLSPLPLLLPDTRVGVAALTRWWRPMKHQHYLLGGVRGHKHSYSDVSK